MSDNSSTKNYFIYRIRLENLKSNTWRLIVLARFLFILAELIRYYARQA